jgi:5'-3' exonuclease, N-terminal resolvase-like domain
MKVDNLLFDVSGMLYRTYNALQATQGRSAVRKQILDDDDDSDSELPDIGGMALHSALQSMNKSYKQFQPKRVVACFDTPGNWRKKYMESGLAVSRLKYKGQRRKDFTPTQLAAYYKFLDHINEFQEILTTMTGIIVLAAPLLEADDCIAGWVQQYPDEVNVILTGDSDMHQLITGTTHVCDYKTAELVKMDDPEFYIFEKCFRGDMASDNVASAYPGIRSTRLKKAYTDKLELVNILEEQWHNPVAYPLPDNEGDEPRVIKVKEILEENQMLIDLGKQPPAIRKLMEKVVTTNRDAIKKFDFWKFSAFCTRTKLKKISQDLQTFRPLLIGGHGIKNRPTTSTIE